MSLGMSFARRRMMAAAKKEPKYVWAVYAADFVLDEDASGSTSGFITNRMRTKMASDSYEINGLGFTLINAVSTQVRYLKVGQYIVNNNTDSSDDISGEYLYEITGSKQASTSSTSWDIDLYRYESKAIKTGNELYRVESDALDYPVDGERDGLWYVLVEGEV